MPDGGPETKGRARPRGLAGMDIRRLLVARLDNIGDLVMLGPALRAIRSALPGAHVTLWTSPAGSQVAPMLPWVDDLIVTSVMWQDVGGAGGGQPGAAALPARWGTDRGNGPRRDRRGDGVGPDPGRELALVERLRQGGFDAAIVFTSFSQSPHPPALICYLAGIAVRAAQSKEFAGAVLSHPVDPLPDSAHQVDRNLWLVERLGIPTAGRHLELHVPPDASGDAARLLEAAGIEDGEPFIAAAPAASCQARTYPLERWPQLARILAAESGWPVVVLGREKDDPRLRPVVGAHPGVRSLVGRTSVPALADVVRRSQLVLAGNSGPMHLADAFGIPTVVTYSGTDLESQWRPRHVPAVLLRRPTACSPCYLLECPYERECMGHSAEEVADAALRLIAAGAPAPAGGGRA